MPAREPLIMPEVSSDPELKEADWVNQMRAHYAESGSYRAEDITKILGDPRQHADVTVDSDQSIGSRLLGFW